MALTNAQKEAILERMSNGENLVAILRNFSLTDEEIESFRAEKKSEIRAIRTARRPAPRRNDDDVGGPDLDARIAELQNRKARLEERSSKQIDQLAKRIEKLERRRGGG